MESLQTICLVRVGHPHGVQDLLQSLALHHPTPIRVTGAHDCPQLKDSVDHTRQINCAHQQSILTTTVLQHFSLHCHMFVHCCYPKGCAAPSSVRCQCNTRGPLSKLKRTPPHRKINVTSKSPVGDISVVTLIRTDTTLDHSQKAEKV